MCIPVGAGAWFGASQVMCRLVWYIILLNKKGPAIHICYFSHPLVYLWIFLTRIFRFLSFGLYLSPFPIATPKRARLEPNPSILPPSLAHSLPLLPSAPRLPDFLFRLGLIVHSVTVLLYSGKDSLHGLLKFDGCIRRRYPYLHLLYYLHSFPPPVNARKPPP
jgi:hypothetical protein